MVIVSLMYKYGLRIGEVLGLTFEDIEPSDAYGFYRLIIRDRLSDKQSQRGKGVMSPSKIDDYNNPAYNTEGNSLGYQVVVIDSEMEEMIQEYIDESRDDILLNKSLKKRENLKIKASADKVSTIQLLNNENQYIFLNYQHYTPLTQSGWNYTLRKIFEEVGIVIDKGSKSTNLSHRFRHGFAMNLVRNKVEIHQLAFKLRHSSLESCKVYYNPDEEDQALLLKQNNERFKETYNNDYTSENTK